jgi:hypothetical protein
MLILIPIVPLLGLSMLVWVLADPWWHPLMIAVAIAVVTVGAVNGVRRIITNERAVGLTSRPLDNYRWLPQWDAAQYLSNFELFLRARGWRIVQSSAVTQDRVLVVADKSKSKSRIALLGLRPGQSAVAGDVDNLDTARKAQRATRAAIVVDTKPSAEDTHAALDRGILTLRFADLGTLENVLNVMD